MTLAKKIVVAAALTVVVAVVAGASMAQTGGLSCGDTITTDTTLDSDLLGCPSNGIVIGADNITLDLGGHTVSGDGKPVRRCPRRQLCDFGIANDGHDGVTVRNGSVEQFAFGVSVGRARENRVLDISSSQNTFFGFVVFRSAQIFVRGSSGSRNIAPEGDGMGLFESHDVRIVDNEFRRNPGPGIHVQASTDNLIKGNLISHSSPGILLGGERRADRADRNQIRRNRFVRNAAGVLLGRGNRNVIARNRFSRDGDGIAIENARGNRVARNVILDARKNGIYLGLNEPPIGGGDNVVRRNVVRRSGEDGFKVRSKDHHSLLIGNLARRSGDDGFDVESSSTKLVRNRAVGNDDLGIEAVEGVSEGGGNRASGNGDPRQCVNVRCR
ncbi:MAG TPA: right-handed parallel beta-helix repeat-containing protein [Vicinamibacterales bacterium]|jgi:large repetitive protein|nr:right-handed parallel beta-helix repeat-containing protein [Vicinamibacterales bacterium]